MRALIAAAGLLCCAGGYAEARRAPAAASLATLPPLFADHTDGIFCFRIPAIVRTPDGTLLAFAEARRGNCLDFGDVRIVLRRSRDGGRTWGPLQVVASNGDPQAGNAAPVVDTLDPRYPKGRVFLFYCTGNEPESDILRGQGERRVWYRTSVDDGATWSAPVEITASVKRPEWRAYATGPGHALELTTGADAGRILVPANHSEGAPLPHGRSYAANTFFSDDHGKTWHIGATVAYPGSNESTAAQGPGGEVVMNSRDQTGASHARVISISRSGGARWDSTFIAHELPDPTCEGSMVSYVTRKGLRVLLFSNEGNRTARRDLTISVSWDGGRTWPKHTIVYPGSASYSDIVVMANGRLGILFERGGDGIVFATLPIQPLL